MPPLSEAALTLGAAAALAAAYTIASFAFGLFLLDRFWIRQRAAASPPLSAWSGTAFALGQGLLGMLWQTLASVGLFRLAVVLPILLAAAASGWRPLVAWALMARRSAVGAAGRFAAADSAGRLVGASVAVVMGLYLFLALHPPGGDALAFYLAQPKIIASSETFLPLRGYEGLAQIGLIGEMHYAALFLFGGDTVGELAAKLSVWPTGLCGAVLLWALVGAVGGRLAARMLGLVLLFSSTAFTNILWDGKTEIFATAYGLAAIWWAMQAQDARYRRALALAGLGAGLAVVAKLSLAIALPPMLAALATWRIAAAAPRGKAGGLLWRGALAGAAGFVPPLAALVLKNGLVFGEPLAPFLIFSGSAPPWIEQAWFSPENTRWVLLTYPLALLFGQYPMEHGNLSALWLALLPLLFAVRGAVGRDLAGLSLAAALGVAAWMALRPSVLAPRYILPVLLALLPLAATAAALPWRRPALAWARVPVAAGALLMLGLTAGTDLVKHGPAAWRFARMTPAHYDDPLWQVAHLVGEATPPGARIVMAMYQRAMLRPDLIECLVDVTEILSTEPARTAAQRGFWAAVHERGGRFLLLDRATHESAAGAGLAETPPPWLTLARIDVGDAFVVYRLEAASGSPVPQLRCVERRPGLWLVERAS